MLKVLFADLLWEKNTAEWLADLVDKLKRTGRWRLGKDSSVILGGLVKEKRKKKIEKKRVEIP
jgi:hypothetical protein